MGNNSKKKVHSLPPLGKDSKPRGRRKNETAGLNVQVPDRQRLIGSPAPQSMRRMNEKHNRAFKKTSSSGEFPTITLSACEDDSDDEDSDEAFVQRDSVIDVGQVGGGLRSRTNSASNMSMTSLGSLVEIHRSMSARSGLTPPPRFLSMKDGQGTMVMSELTQLDNVEKGDTDQKPEKQNHETRHRTGQRSSRGHHRRNSALPSLSPSRSGSSSLSSSHGNGKLPSKYPTLDPIKTRQHREHKHIGRSRRHSISE